LSSLYDTYLYHINNKIFNDIHTDEDVIRFYKDETPNNNDDYVHVNIQRQGIFTKFIATLVTNDSNKSIYILAVESHEMVSCLKKIKINDRNFVDHGDDFIMISKKMINNYTW